MMMLCIEQLERRDMVTDCGVGCNLAPYQGGTYFLMDAEFSRDDVFVGQPFDLTLSVQDTRANPRGINGTSAVISLDWDAVVLASTPGYHPEVRWSGWEILIDDPIYGSGLYLWGMTPVATGVGIGELEEFASVELLPVRAGQVEAEVQLGRVGAGMIGWYTNLFARDLSVDGDTVHIQEASVDALMARIGELEQQVEYLQEQVRACVLQSDGTWEM